MTTKAKAPPNFADSKQKWIGHVHDLNKRIRGLEAELANLGRGYDGAFVRAEDAERRIAEHDAWCEYRKRLDLSFALGELSGAIQATPTSGGKKRKVPKKEFDPVAFGFNTGDDESP